ncbi:hypothetical protein [Streptomyces spirodelae]|uniref:Uncharacterized protein n=1 Tax=Streptomyces spirodelae TaxID=2812904 RepID=A0ABS3WW80_9ACTN|nr:hypothetical protein [Streptomyces spirodelae]MBO8187378.1 hypothetical protein [Streptomyces spirodelae]
MLGLKQEDHFASAAGRHFRDADYLRDDGRLPAADHLYGFAAECATKSLLLRFTEVTMDPKPGEDAPSSKPWVENPDPDHHRPLIEFGHVNELVKEVALLAHGRAGASLHAALEGDLRVFRRWHVKFRYYDGGYAQADVVTRRRTAAQNILSLHEQAQLNRKLP